MGINKQKILIGVCSVFIVIFGVVLYLWFNKDNNTQVYENNRDEVKEQISGFNGISMMYETGPGTGEYSESKSSLWPEDGYIFNDTLSGCENGGELSWNSETNTVNLLSNSSDACYVYFDAYIIPVINSVTTSNITTDSITLTVNVTNGNNQVTTYYYSKDNGNSYETSNSNKYTFSGLDMGTEYNFSVYVEDSLGYKSEVYTLSETTDDTLLLADWVINQYGGVQGNNGIYYHTSSLANSARDNSYRYSGVNPNNYVCFGSTASTCPSDSLYRIIGVFGNQVKLIKNTSIGNYAWHSDYDQGNTWNATTKPDIYTTLNSTYLNSIENIWSSKITTHNYKVGGMARDDSYTAKQYYDVEAGASQTGYVESMKIGLMYVSDFGYAISNNYWTTALYNYDDTVNNNWLYLNSDEWTISRNFDSSTYAFGVYSSRGPSRFGVSSTRSIRPVFYLNSNVQYSSGSGTSSDPIRLVV